MTSLYGENLFGEEIVPPSRGPVSDDFVFPPFSILDTRSGDWQDRKRAWKSLGIESELGRDAGIGGLGAGNGLILAGESDAIAHTSIFDPVLTELVYRWFCADGGVVVDPFAGGSVRGIVASSVGRHYWGSDLRREQIQANEMQANKLGSDPRPVWVCGDSMETLDDAPEADLIFSCPPYGDLERYSDDPADLSTMEWHTFSAAYRRIIMRSCSRLKDDRFACFVVGDFRDSRGYYRNFVGETITAFLEQGLRLYNEAILVGTVNSASLRVSRQFNASRKLVKMHQNVLIFCKGDGKTAADAAGGQLTLGVG